MTVQSPYSTTTRPEIHPLIPDDARRLLDVGCNDGGFAAWLKQASPGRVVWGVEPNSAQAELARQQCDGVVTELFPDALACIDGDFDCITFNHVLEHMFDPWSALADTRERLVAGGSVVAVIPNIRYLSVLFNLAIRGRWEYQDSGLLDRTHVRFFTRASVIPLFEDAGYKIESLTPVNGIGSVRYPRLSALVSRLLGDVTYGGFAVRATR